ncbi:hypothetical protein V494_08011 [Pseudogymnoascus sp. VKM F-4513 (FW-928)]|nr:hypothetical protein V494_08011 [Pseudogymnoascus sp. VKM F-4513 (FW-928)]
MHTTSTIDYIFILDGSMELGLDSGETRILKKGDSAVQRGTAHWWRNVSKTEPAMLAAVSVGLEGAVADEMRIADMPEEGEGKEKGEKEGQSHGISADRLKKIGHVDQGVSNVTKLVKKAEGWGETICAEAASEN